MRSGSSRGVSGVAGVSNTARGPAPRERGGRRAPGRANLRDSPALKPPREEGDGECEEGGAGPRTASEAGGASLEVSSVSKNWAGGRTGRGPVPGEVPRAARGARRGWRAGIRQGPDRGLLPPLPGGRGVLSSTPGRPGGAHQNCVVWRVAGGGAVAAGTARGRETGVQIFGGKSRAAGAAGDAGRTNSDALERRVASGMALARGGGGGLGGADDVFGPGEDFLHPGPNTW